MENTFSVQYLMAPTDGSANRRLHQFREMSAEKSLAKEKENKTSLRSAAVAAGKPFMPHSAKKARTADLLSMGAMATACIMLVVMLVGLVRLGNVNDQAAQMEAYVVELQQENAKLHKTYEEGYDLEQVKLQAQEMGLVPIEENSQIVITLQEPVQEPVSVWERFGMFLSGLFA